jgi:hypothetical protein
MHMTEMDWLLMIPLGLAVAFMIWVLLMLIKETDAHQHPDGRGVSSRRQRDSEFWK